MDLSTFVQENTIFIGAATILGLYLIYFEIKNIGASKTKISTAKLTRLINDGATVIDLRKAEDFKHGHISGAINVPLETLDTRINSLNKDKPMAVYCAQGVSSSKAVKQLQKAGFDVSQLSGGFAGWTKDGLPVAKK